MTFRNPKSEMYITLQNKKLSEIAKRGLYCKTAFGKHFNALKNFS
ncbi:MAG: hypothetical protein RLZZ628_2672 [Bacteroidota bacterium]|jgi:hypothetical protein